MPKEEYNPFVEVLRTIGLMLGFGKERAAPTADMIRQHQLNAAEIELLEAEAEKEAAFARVEKLKARVRRLKNPTPIN